MKITVKTALLISGIIIIVSAVIFFIILFRCTYPNDKAVKKRSFDIKISQENEYYFYLKKAVAYRMLFCLFGAVYYILKILGTISTLVTIFFVIENDNLFLIFAFLAAFCDSVSLLFPLKNISTTYLECAEKIDCAIINIDDYENCDNKKVLANIYKEAEDLSISKIMKY